VKGLYIMVWLYDLALRGKVEGVHLPGLELTCF
jgi:hypothetical protein